MVRDERKSGQGEWMPHATKACSRRRWICGLVESAGRPEGWPASLAWPRYRQRWIDTIAHAHKVIAHEVALPCDERPEHWGGAMDDHRARRAGWRRIRCAPRVLNHFWRAV